MLVSEISVLSADGKMDMAIFYVLPTNLKYAIGIENNTFQLKFLF